MVICSKTLVADPQNKDCVLGWAVIQREPWALIALVGARETALHMARMKGSDHIVEYCTHRPGTKEFSICTHLIP